MFKRALVVMVCSLLVLAPNAYAGREHRWQDNDNATGKQRVVNDGGGSGSGSGLRAYGTFSARDCSVKQAQNVANCLKDFNGGYTITYKTPMGTDTYVVVGTYTFLEGGGTVVNVNNRSNDKVSFRLTNVDTTNVSYGGDVMFMVLGN